MRWLYRSTGKVVDCTSISMRKNRKMKIKTTGENRAEDVIFSFELLLFRKFCFLIKKKKTSRFLDDELTVAFAFVSRYLDEPNKSWDQHSSSSSSWLLLLLFPGGYTLRNKGEKGSVDRTLFQAVTCQFHQVRNQNQSNIQLGLLFPALATHKWFECKNSFVTISRRKAVIIQHLNRRMYSI